MIKNIGAPEAPTPTPDNVHFDVYERNGKRCLVCEALPANSTGQDKQLMFFDGVRFTYGTLKYLRDDCRFVRRIPLGNIDFILPESRNA